MKEIIKKLSNSKFFSLLSETELNSITEISKLRDYPKNSMIFWQNEDVQYGFAIVTGLVKEFRKYTNNRSKTISYKKDCDLLCNLAYLLPQKYIVSTQALEDTTVLYYPMKEFISIIKNNSASIVYRLRIKEINFEVSRETYERFDKGDTVTVHYTKHARVLLLLKSR